MYIYVYAVGLKNPGQVEGVKLQKLHSPSRDEQKLS